jgi:hypothetical protein
MFYVAIACVLTAALAPVAAVILRTLFARA